MSGSRAYLDHNASAPLTGGARAAMVDALEVFANPSSVHSEGRRARKIIEEARRNVAALVNAQPEAIVFTSGATEAATTLLTPDWTMGRGAVRMSRLYVCAADHPCLLGGGRFAKDRVQPIGVDSDGIIDLEELRTALERHDRDEGLPLVAIHAANNETGVIQPFREVNALVKDAGGVLILDAVQLAGKVSIDYSDGYADYLILSSHKIGGPKGAGAIVGAAGAMMPGPLVVGGGQEKGHRAGTENMPAIAGFGAAAREAGEAVDRMDAVRALRDAAESAIADMVPAARFYGKNAERLPNTTFFAIPGIKAETAQIAFDLAGVALSAGSACSSGKVGPSHVLAAMGHDADAGALRVSLGLSTTRAEIDFFAAALSEILARRDGRTKAA